MCNNNSLNKDLNSILDSKCVLMKPIELAAHAGDASIYRLLPQAVVMPKNEKDVRSILKYCTERNLHLTFRAAGTSLSGQSVTDGLLVSLGRHWKEFKILEDGRTVAAQPGVVGGKLNEVLAQYGYKIGPDPASINAAMIGGIASNNSAGLCCGLEQNTYSSLEGIRIIFADGYVLDTNNHDADERLRNERPDLVKGILTLRDEITSDPELAERIRHKYRIRNTTGYSLNSLVDYENPLDIISHLMVGAEGTLAFLSEIRYKTFPLPKCWACSLIYFKDLKDVGEIIFKLKEMGAAVVELMDKASMRAIEKDVKYNFSLTPNCVSLLVELQEENEEVLQSKLKLIGEIIQPDSLLENYEFTRDIEKRNFYWGIRKGVFPSLGALRETGTSVIIEDVVFPMKRVEEAIPDLQNLIYHAGFPCGIVFGHAKEGNFHPVICQDFSNPKTVQNYAHFMDDLADLVLNKYDGSFKGEHGTGRNVAPFVEMEWGNKAYELMERIKNLFDPQGILNPGVLLNRDSQVHLKNLKEMPTFSKIADPCIECGYCEIKCPSHDLTLSPRQRISVMREITRLSAIDKNDETLKQLKEDYKYYGVETCAADGMCATACPVKIDTGKMIKVIREESHSAFSQFMANFTVKNYRLMLWGANVSLGLAQMARKFLGNWSVYFGSKVVSLICDGGTPVLSGEIPVPGSAPKLPKQLEGKYDRSVVYFPSCLTRTMGSLEGEDAPEGLAQTIQNIFNHFKWDVLYPKGIYGLSCGQPFTSKGFPSEGTRMMEKLVKAFEEVSNGGEIPIVCDTSPCTGQILSAGEYLEEPYLSIWKKLKIYDLSTFLRNEVLVEARDLKKLPVHVILHPTCTIRKIGADKDLLAIAELCSEKVTVPVMAECCGFAGDRGLLHPELTLAATAPESKEVLEIIKNENFRFISTCRTCEMGMTAGTGKVYQSIAYLISECISN